MLRKGWLLQYFNFRILRTGRDDDQMVKFELKLFTVNIRRWYRNPMNATGSLSLFIRTF